MILLTNMLRVAYIQVETSNQISPISHYLDLIIQLIFQNPQLAFFGFLLNVIIPFFRDN